MPTINPIRPSAPIRIKYEARILRLLDEMQRSIVHWLSLDYRRNLPEVMVYAQDACPARTMQAAMRRLRKRWLGRFDDLAPAMASYFATAVQDRSEKALMSDLRAAGLTVRFKATKAMNDAYQAVIGENVGLIRSIAEQHLTQVETMVMQSVQAGRDLATLTQGLEKRYAVSRRRASMIALDQNNKATAVLTRARHLELGITEARWLHSAGGKIPRKEHVDFTGQRYSIAKGHDFENGEGVVWPGTAIRCRCVSVPIVPGFDD
jgi:uncharacterized protein with gpF-like domain